MTSMIKMAGAAVAALVVGGLVGYLLGASSMGDLERDLSKAKNQAADALGALEHEREECKARVGKARTRGKLLRAKEELLRTVIEISASNFGLASQHMARARGQLKAAQRGLSKAAKDRLTEIFDRMADAQTLTMRLDHTAKIQIDQIIHELQRFPTAR